MSTISQRLADGTADPMDRSMADAAGQMLDALEALGALPEGYCFCAENRDATKPDEEHTGECRDARAAIAAARSTPRASAPFPD